MANIAAHPHRGVARNKPDRAVDSCFATDGSLIASGRRVWDGILDDRDPGACTQHFPIYSSSRRVAGGPYEGLTEHLRTHRGEPELDAYEFLKLAREKLKLLDLDDSFLNRGVNEGFSGGEKKRNEILQMLLFEPKLALLDETDSGLDIDALKIVADGVNRLRDPQRSIVLVTHYQRLLDHIEPDRVHVLMNGRIVKSGDAELARTLEARGYDWLRAEAA